MTNQEPTHSKTICESATLRAGKDSYIIFWSFEVTDVGRIIQVTWVAYSIRNSLNHCLYSLSASLVTTLWLKRVVKVRACRCTSSVREPPSEQERTVKSSFEVHLEWLPHRCWKNCWCTSKDGDELYTWLLIHLRNSLNHCLYSLSAALVTTLCLKRVVKVCLPTRTPTHAYHWFYHISNSMVWMYQCAYACIIRGMCTC